MNRSMELVLSVFSLILFILLFWVDKPNHIREWVWIIWLTATYYVLGRIQISMSSFGSGRCTVVLALGVIIAFIVSYYFEDFVSAIVLGSWWLTCVYLLGKESLYSKSELRVNWIVTNLMICVLLLFMFPTIHQVEIKLKNVAVPTHFAWYPYIDGTPITRACGYKYFVNHSPKKESFTLCSPRKGFDNYEILLRAAVNRQSGLNIVSIQYATTIGFIPFRFSPLRKDDLHGIVAAKKNQNELLHYRPLRVLVQPILPQEPVWLSLPKPENAWLPLRLLVLAVLSWQLVSFGFFRLCPLYNRLATRIV